MACLLTPKQRERSSASWHRPATGASHTLSCSLLACCLLHSPARLAVAPALPGGFLALVRAGPARACGVSGAHAQVPQQLWRQQHSITWPRCDPCTAGAPCCPQTLHAGPDTCMPGLAGASVHAEMPLTAFAADLPEHCRKLTYTGTRHARSCQHKCGLWGRQPASRDVNTFNTDAHLAS